MPLESKQRKEWQLIKELIDNIPDAVYFKDRKGRLVLVNRAHAGGLGLTPDQVIGKTDLDFFPSHQAELMTEDDRKVMKKGVPITDVFERTTRPDGSRHYVSTTKLPRRDKRGRVIGIMGITRDITERTQIEENRYHLLFDTSPNCIFVISREGRWLDVNGAGLKMLGFKNKIDLFKKRLIDLFLNPKERKSYLKEIHRRGFVSSYRVDLKRKDGKIIHVSVHAVAQRDHRKRVVGYQGILLNVTAQKHAEEEKERAILRLNQRLSELSCLYRFEELCRKEGLSIGEILQAVLNILPQGLPYSEQMSGRLVFRKWTFRLGRFPVSSKRQKFPIIVNKKKVGFLEVWYRQKFAHGHKTLFPIEEIRLIEMITKRLGLFMERRMMDDAFRKTLKDLTDFKFALDSSSIVSITDSNGKISYVNDRFCEITKYSWEELVGQDHRILNAGYHPKEFFKNLWVTIQAGHVWTGEVKNKAKDGTFHWTSTTIVPFLNNKGKPYQYIAIRNEITRRKAMEDTLKGLPQRIIQAQESERHHIAREIHDDFGQSLAILKMMIQSQMNIPTEDFMTRQEANQRITSYLDTIIDKSRHLAAGLRPTTLDILGLSTALKMMIKDVTDKKGVQVKFNSTRLDNLVFPGEVINLYRIVQEALTNVVTHSNASRVEILIRRKNQRLWVTIQDNGKGFDLDHQEASLGEHHGLGLSTMEERAKLLGGDLRIYSQLGRGTTVLVNIPVKLQEKK